jgi:hypothetical protein
MFDKPPKILAHKSALDKGNFVIPEYILNKGETSTNLFHRHCPHRMYPLAEPGEFLGEITCKFHDFKWDLNGVPINNDKKLVCGGIPDSKSGLITLNFNEPDVPWIRDLANEKDLVYSHSTQGTSKGSWLWFMDTEIDLLHLTKTGIHPWLSHAIDPSTIELSNGDTWVCQTHPYGWWVFIYPFTLVEWGGSGRLAISYTIPNDKNNEFGFSYMTQYYYSPSITSEQKEFFEMIDVVYKEDLEAVEKLKGPFFPLMKAVNRYEDHCVLWGNWVRQNRTSA